MLKKILLISMLGLSSIIKTQAKEYVFNVTHEDFTSYDKNISDTVRTPTKLGIQGDISFSSEKLIFTPSTGWQGIYLDLPLHDDWGPKPTLEIMHDVFATTDFRIFAQYTKNDGSKTFGFLIEDSLITSKKEYIGSKTPETGRETFTKINPIKFSLPDMNPEQPIRFIIQKAKLENGGFISFNNVGSKGDILSFSYSTPESYRDDLYDARKKDVQNLHTNFVAAGRDARAYFTALNTLATELQTYYQGDFSQINHRHIEAFDRRATKKVRRTSVADFSADHATMMVEALSLSPEEITFENFWKILGYDRSKANAEILFTRLAIWCLGAHKNVTKRHTIVSLNAAICDVAQPETILRKIGATLFE